MYKWGEGGCCFQGPDVTLSPSPRCQVSTHRCLSPLLSFEGQATLLQWQSCPHEAREDPEAPERGGAGLSGSRGQGYHLPTFVLRLPFPPATSAAQGVL